LGLQPAWDVRLARHKRQYPLVDISFGGFIISDGAALAGCTQFSSVTSYPFAMGWSETSRFYYPSLFLSEKIFGSRLPWPILHPSLHLMLLCLHYLVDAPL
jgi:hypothetical protein